MQASSQTALGKEVKALNDRLKHWKLSLNAQQLAELKGNGVVDVFVRRPFEHLKMLQLDHPPVMLTYSHEFPKPKFTYLKQEGDGWVEVEPEIINDGEPFKIVTDFERPPDTTTIDLELDWDVLDGPVTITLTRSDGLFQSDVMQLVHSDKTWLMPVN